MSLQKALLLPDRCGEFVIGQVPIPKAGPAEVVVKVKAVALNPIDWKIQKYGVIIENFPAVLGFDIAGEVVELGEGVTEVALGDRVIFGGALDNEYAGFQEYTKGEVKFVSKIPPNVSYEQAATLPVTLATAYLGLYNGHPLGMGLQSFLNEGRGAYANTPLLVIGGPTSVGQYVIQLAKQSGFSPIIATASPKHESFLKSLGATHIIDRSVPFSALKSEIEKITQVPITVIYDAVGLGETQSAVFDVLAPGGQLLSAVDDARVGEGEGEGKGGDNKRFSHVISFKSIPGNHKSLLELFANVSKLLEEGTVQPNRVEVVPGGLRGIREGLKRMENNQVSGIKLVVRPEETAA